MNADGGDQKRLASHPAEDGFPSWLDDGRIVFTSARDGQADIYVMDATGSNVTRLTRMSAGQPAASPDGQKIAFVSTGLEQIGGHLQFQIFLMDADGNNQKILTSSTNSTFLPCWLPDGKAIAFHVDKFGVKANIFQIDLDGKNIKRLTAGPRIDARPAFSRDGSKLAFQSNRDGDYEIYVLTLH